MQSAHFAREALKIFPSLRGIGNGGEPFEFFGEFEGESFFRASGDEAGARAGIDFRAIGSEFAETGAALFVEQPIAKSAPTPGGNVVFGDGAAGETMSEDALDFRQRIKPGDQFPAERAVVEAAVEFVANGGGKAGDFSGAGAHRVYFLTTDPPSPRFGAADGHG
jgi:hypothetical protein